MDIREAIDQSSWDNFLSTRRFRPFMQSWTMGEVYRDVRQPPIRLEIRDGKETIGICQAIVVNAKRGKHLAVLYGPVLNDQWQIANCKLQIANCVIEALKEQAQKHNCSFIRISPFVPEDNESISGSKPSPLHLLAEHIWYLPLQDPDPWTDQASKIRTPASKEVILANMRKNTRNLIRRAEKEGVTVRASAKPTEDLHHFFTLYDETRKRHGFVPYPNAFITAQTARFSRRDECTLYLAEYEGEVIAASVHMHAYGETSYHHGASTHKFNKIPASYLLQWTAICDALQRGDHIYSFWGIAPPKNNDNRSPNHPFSGVTTFKTGFGGNLLNLSHCVDIPVRNSYYMTRAFETIRKWKRGF